MSDLTPCPRCGREARIDEGRPGCYYCRQHEQMVRTGLRHCRIAPLPSANLWKTSSPLAVIGSLELSHYGRGYWVVNGPVPLAIARELYADPCGRDLIRVAGHCGCPAPEGWATFRDPATGKMYADRENEAQCERVIAHGGAMAKHAVASKESCIFVDDPSAHGVGTVDSYHIDGDLGLRVFVDTLERHNLFIPAAPPAPRATNPGGANE